MKINQRRNEFALTDVKLGIQDGGKQSIMNKSIKDLSRRFLLVEKHSIFYYLKQNMIYKKNEIVETPINASKRFVVCPYKLARGDPSRHKDVAKVL